MADRMLFLNLPVRDLKRSVAFWTALGFQFNPKFTDENATCMLIGKDAFAMLLVDDYFRTFTKRKIADTSSVSEALFALSCESRDEVERLHEKAIAAGATQAMDPQDHGFMYVRSFYDLDGHHWELMWMDPAAAQ